MNEGDGTSEEGLTGGISKTTEISYTETPKPREGV